MNLSQIFFPKRCLGCKKFGTYLCSSCKDEILQTDLVCPSCEKASVGGITHPLCAGKFRLNGLWSLGIYQGSLKSGVQKLKYRFVRELAQVLVDLTIEYWAGNSPYLLDRIAKDRGEGWLITAVPLHKKRQNWRGFNQSELIAKLFAEKMGLKYENLLLRTKYTKPQVGLLSRDRKRNIKDAFSLYTKYPLHHTNVILVDDVWTTGSTLKECTYVLKRGGVKEVWGLTLAR